MLNFKIAMLKLCSSLIPFLAIQILQIVGAFAFNSPEIEYPEPGDMLQGVIIVLGDTDVYGFHSSEISFSYSLDTATEWFLIHSSTEPINNGTLAVWDTTTITDGTYQLRVLVHLDNGQDIETIVPKLRVRNYTTIETDTPIPEEQFASTEVIIPATPQSTIMPTPKPLYQNPAQVTLEELRAGLIKGMIVSAIIAGLIAAYLLLQKWINR